MGELVKFEAVQDLAKRYGVEGEALIGTVRAVAMPKPHTEGELISCLLVAREHGLNPLTKEIFFMRTKGNQIQPIVSVDGWMRKANEHPQYDGCEFETIRGKDGEVVAMRCSIFRKDRSRPITVEEDLKECAGGGGPVWKSHPNRMLRNRAFCQAARLAFGFAGLMEPDEFRQWQDNPEIVGGELVTVDVETIEPRDGGDLVLKGEPRKRTSSSAAKDDEDLRTRFNELKAALAAETDQDALLAAFDSFERDGMPWAEFPVGWARILQETYHYALRDAVAEEPEDDSDDEAVERAIASAQTVDELNHLWQCWDESDQDKFRSAYMSRYNELEPTLL